MKYPLATGPELVLERWFPRASAYMPNPSGLHGTYYWTPGTGVSVYSSEEQYAYLKSGEMDTHLIFRGTAVNQEIKSDRFPMPAGINYLNPGPRWWWSQQLATKTQNVEVEMHIDMFDSNGNLITNQYVQNGVYINDNYAYTNGWNDTTIWRNYQANSYASIAMNATPVPAFYQFRYKVTGAETDGSWEFYVRNAEIESWGSSSYTYQPNLFYPEVLPHDSVIAYNIRRGNRSNGVVDQLEIGTLDVVAKGRWDDIGSWHTSLEKNDNVRLRMKQNGRYVTLFAGKVVQLERNLGQTAKDDRIHFVVADTVNMLAKTQQPSYTGGSFKQRLTSITKTVFPTGATPPLNGNTTSAHNPRVNNRLIVTDTAADTSTPVIIKKDAAVLDMLMIARNTERGLVYVDRRGNVRAYARNSIPTWASPMVFRDVNLQAGERKMLVSGFDTNQETTQIPTGLTLVVNGVGASSGNPYTLTYGPWTLSSVPTFTSEVEVAGLSETNTDAATAYLHLYHKDQTDNTGNVTRIIPPRTIEQFKWNATDEYQTAAMMEIYDPIQVYYSRNTGMITDYRVLALDHEITPQHWITTVYLRPKELNTSTTTVVLPYDSTGNQNANAAPNGTINVVPT